MTNLLDYLGRLHPLMLHLPIGIYVLAFFLQYLKPKRIVIHEKVLSILLNTGLISACLTWFFGWLLSRSGDYGENNVFWHQWSSLAFLFSAIWVSVLYLLKSKYLLASYLYHVSFFLSLSLVTIAGHFGAEITHGKGFLLNESSIESIGVQSRQTDTFSDSTNLDMPSIQAADTISLTAARKAGFTIKPVSIASGFLEVSAVNLKDLKNDQISLLKPFAENILWISLADHSLTDAGLTVIAFMKNIRKIDLRNTGAGDQFLSDIKSLQKLEYLNLVGTNVTGKGLDHLKSIKSLKRIYCWKTKITEADVDDFRSSRTGVSIYIE